MDTKQKSDTVEPTHSSAALDAARLESNQYLCSLCGRILDVNEKDEHDDWHLALNLQANEQDAEVARGHTAQVPSILPGQDLSQGGDTNRDDPPSYAPSRMPNSDGTNRVSSMRHHTNQVIEAAKVRARDEVSVPPILTWPLASTNRFLAIYAERATESAVSVWHL